ncbi:hypothetical protein GCM10010862_23180 [Devosia nitrariae]|uniref:Uncharacterized protein n=1 Tax=Devosia nitrariae TaxID=2071872 RepID=A0ABQ5W4S3_9HYPH|nr:hypothetical protein GCM10010862_23180 [Devosia nitrariae]
MLGKARCDGGAEHRIAGETFNEVSVEAETQWPRAIDGVAGKQVTRINIETVRLPLHAGAPAWRADRGANSATGDRSEVREKPRAAK